MKNEPKVAILSAFFNNFAEGGQPPNATFGGERIHDIN